MAARDGLGPKCSPTDRHTVYAGQMKDTHASKELEQWGAMDHSPCQPIAVSTVCGPHGRAYDLRSKHKPIRSVLTGWLRAFGGWTGSARLCAVIRRGLGAILFGGLVVGCQGLQPHRTDGPVAGLTCNPDLGYDVAGRCRTQMHEHSDNYDLFFTEFTDQGLQYPSREWGEAGYQINHTIKGLKQIAEDHEGVSLVVFVHGWQHNAKHDDGNVISFRKLLQSAASIEQAGGSKHRVVGVYVGWRGRSIDAGGLLSNLSFWTRKSTALRVAQGSPRELFNRLRGFKCAQNLGQGQKSSPGDCTELAGGSSRPKVRMLMIGHSFGGWILYNAVAGSLVESLTQDIDMDDRGIQRTKSTRYADMVILLNPAFEASRYTPLHRIATTRPRYSHYQAPLLVSVTTDADQATRIAFPMGRFINTIFENETGDEEGDAIKYTMGHMPDYVTHRLRATDKQPIECANWKLLNELHAPTERRRQAEVNLKAEEVNRVHFWNKRQPLDEGWDRTFCSESGGVRLEHKQHDPNSIIWNVSTDNTIMRNHNDIENPSVSEFLRQLYQDTLPHPTFQASAASKSWSGSPNASTLLGTLPAGQVTIRR